MTKNNFKYHIHWIHMLAWRALDVDDLSKEERKAIGAFIGYVKNGKYISEKNTVLANVTKIVDAHSQIKSTQMPEMQEEYTKEERMAINRGIRALHKTLDGCSPVWAYCQRYLYCKTGNRNRRTPSANKLNLAKMTLAIHGI